MKQPLLTADAGRMFIDCPENFRLARHCYGVLSPFFTPQIIPAACSNPSGFMARSLPSLQSPGSVIEAGQSGRTPDRPLDTTHIPNRRRTIMSEQNQIEPDPRTIEAQKEAAEVFQDFSTFIGRWELNPLTPESSDREVTLDDLNGNAFRFIWICQGQSTKAQRQKQLRMFLFDVSLGNLTPGKHTGRNYLALPELKKN
jgi:hypothetical protein